MRCKLYKRYSVYYRDSEMPVIIHGTAQECAAACGVKESTFYSYISRINAGKQDLVKFLIYEDERGAEELQQTISKLPEFYKLVILSVAENNMRISKVARELKKPRNSIDYAIMAIKEDTGKDPLKFYDLCDLVKMAKGGNGNGVAKD